MGQEWDGSKVAFDVSLWREVYRVLKPGAFLLAFGGDRTFHRLACGIELVRYWEEVAEERKSDGAAA